MSAKKKQTKIGNFNEKITYISCVYCTDRVRKDFYVLRGGKKEYVCRECWDGSDPPKGSVSSEKSEEHACEGDDCIPETPMPVLLDRSDRLAKLTHKLRVFSSNCELRANIALEYSLITKNQTLHTVETAQAAILIQTYETIRHFLNNPDEPQEEEAKSVTESAPMGGCDFCDSPADHAPSLCINCAERFGA